MLSCDLIRISRATGSRLSPGPGVARRLAMECSNLAIHSSVFSRCRSLQMIMAGLPGRSRRCLGTAGDLVHLKQVQDAQAIGGRLIRGWKELASVLAFLRPTSELEVDEHRIESPEVDAGLFPAAVEIR